MRIEGRISSPRMATVNSGPLSHFSTSTSLSCSNASSSAGSNASALSTFDMPTLEPSRLGFTITGRPSAAIRALNASLRPPVMSPRSSATHGATGKPAPCQSSLVRSLSMVMADAITPLPV